jgi:DNA-binding NtrC family response regulator
MSHHIIAVAEDASVRASLKKVLEQAGYTVELAPGAEQGFAHLESDNPGLLLLDLDLPNQTGWDLLEYVTRRSPTIPVVIITGSAPRSWDKDVVCLAPVLEKPLDTTQLLSTIKRFLEEPREVRLRRFCAFLESKGARSAVDQQP